MATYPQILNEAEAPGGRRVLGWQLAISLAVIGYFFWVAFPTKYYFLNDDFQHIPYAGGGHFVFGGLFRPLGDLSLWLDFRLWGKTALGYHITNILIHLSNSALVYLLAIRFFRTYSVKRDVLFKSWVSALAFLIYAFHSESVLWVICRSASLGTLFFLAASYFYMRRQKRWYWLLSLCFFGLGLLCYESIWVFPLVALFISIADISQKRTAWKSEWRFPLVPLMVLLFFLLFIRVLRGNFFSDYTFHNIYGFNFQKLFFNYNALLARSFLPPMASSWVFLSSYVVLLALINLLVFILIRNKKATQLIWLLIGCFAISLFPAISLGMSTHNSESDRYIYLPSVFLIMLVIEFIFLLGRNRFIRLTASCCFLLLHGIVLYGTARNFAYAGKVVNLSLNALNGYPPANTIYFVGVPIQCQGAIMFRGSLPFALRWICPGLNYKRLDLVSQQQYGISGEFQIRHYSGIGALSQAGFWQAARGKEYTMVDLDNRKVMVASDDMIIEWTQNSVLIVRQ